jgi:hypothetical protein
VSTEEATEIKDILSNIAHFITDRKSKLLYTDLSAIVTDIWSRLGEASELTTFPARLLNVLQNQISYDAFSLILEDASIILRPRVVTEVKGVIEPDRSGNITPDSHPNEAVLRVLSDMATLYGHGDVERSTPKRRDVATSHKLEYYAARVVCVPAMTLRVLADEVLARSKLIILESGSGGEQSEGFVSPSTRTTPVRPRPIIEEL